MNTVEVNLGKRNSSIELLRIVAMVTIVYFHFHARDFSLYVLGNERIQEKGLFLHTVLHHLGMLGSLFYVCFWVLWYKVQRKPFC